MVKVMETPRSVGQPAETESCRARRAGPRGTPEALVPSWAELPALRRRRLVAVLGEMVLRNRAGKGGSHDGA